MPNRKEHPTPGKYPSYAGLFIMTALFLFPAASETPLSPSVASLPYIERDTIEMMALLPEPPDEPAPFQCILEIEEVCRFYDIIVMAANRYEVETPLVMAIIQTESRYDPNALSPKGAQGLMQLMPRTARSLGVEDSFDPEENVNAGVRYYKKMLKKVEGDRDLALAAYNAGLQNVRKHGGVPPFPETQHYVRKVLLWYDRYKHMEEMQVPVQAAVTFNGAAPEADSYRSKF